MIEVSAREIPVDELNDYCDSLARDLMKDHEKRFADRIRAVKEATVGLGNAATRFASGVKNAWGTLDKTTSEYGLRLAQIIQENSQHLSRKETKPNFHDAESFHEDSVEALNKIIINVRKYVPKLHRGLKPEMATLNSALAKLENSIRALEKALDESPGLKLDSLQRETQLIVRKHNELLTLRSENEKANIALESASSHEKELLLEKQALTSGPDFLELKRYEDSLSLKEDKMKQFLQPLTKPLLKFERATSQQGSTIDIRTLRNLIEMPVETIVTGQSFAIGQVLNSLESTLQQGQLEVEERKRRKAEETIKFVKDGAIERMREEYLALQANLQETLRQLRSRGLIEKRDRLDGLLTENRTEKEALMARQRDLQRRMEDLTKTILKQKSSLESQIFKIAHKTISIRAA